MDLSTIIGIVIGVGGILIGHTLEGGHFSSLIQLTAGLIVFGGTAGATIVANTQRDLKLGLQLLAKAFKAEDQEYRRKVAEELIGAAQLARRETILSLEKLLPSFSEPFMRNVLRFVVDGVDTEVLRKMFESQIRVREERDVAGSKIWSDAGGFAPTIGIIGAVLGLIHVMANIQDTSELGKGIAVAFVATIYGVGSANLIFLPIATKIKRKAFAEADLQRMILDGATAIGAGLNPYLVQEKISGYLEASDAKGGSV